MLLYLHVLFFLKLIIDCLGLWIITRLTVEALLYAVGAGLQWFNQFHWSAHLRALVISVLGTSSSPDAAANLRQKLCLKLSDMDPHWSARIVSWTNDRGTERENSKFA